MKIVKVTYTTITGFVEQNKSNIQQVMADLQLLNDEGINYNCCLAQDGKTFVHTAFFKEEENQKTLNALPSFIIFQEQLKSAGFEVPPKQELMQLVGTSNKILHK